jgi:RNA polymerase sigma-70 factor, ECF subfamily
MYNFFSMSAGPPLPSGITRVLEEWRAGDDTALARLTPLIYDELRRLARSYLRSRPEGTLQPTALVHEFYLRVGGLRDVKWEGRGQFLAAAAKVMRNVLVDEARRKSAAKRFGGAATDEEPAAPAQDLDVVDVHRALGRMALEYPRHAEVVELMFFGGLTAAEAADALTACGRTTSTRTVERDWKFARGWLYRELRSS